MGTRSLRVLMAGLVCLGGVGCREKPADAPPPPPPAAAPSLPPPAPPPAPPPTPPADSGEAPPADAGAPASQAEVEFFGSLTFGKVKAAKAFMYVSRQACDAPTDEVEVLGRIESIPGHPEFFLEIFQPQGSTGHVCAVGLDAKGRVIGLATYAKNPLTFEGQGEVVFSGIVLKLAKVSPRPPPSGL